MGFFFLAKTEKKHAGPLDNILVETLFFTIFGTFRSRVFKVAIIELCIFAF